MGLMAFSFRSRISLFLSLSLYLYISLARAYVNFEIPLSRADLSRADLSRADLSRADSCPFPLLLLFFSCSIPLPFLFLCPLLPLYPTLSFLPLSRPFSPCLCQVYILIPCCLFSG